MPHIHWILAAAHVLAGAAWFGAMLYSLTVLHPRARLFFKDPVQFEEFLAWIAAGARWKVLGGAAFIAITGAGLWFASGKGSSSTIWNVCILAKTLLFALAVMLFCWVSWKLWPARVMASVKEIPQFQRKFRMVAVLLLLLVGGSMVLGVLCSHL